MDDVISEMARRLRASGQWDNTIGDRLGFYLKRVEMLESYHQAQQLKVAGHREVRRPFADYAACRDVLAAIAKLDRQQAVESALTLAVLLEKWESGGVKPPSDIRSPDVGSIVVEWEKARGGRLMIIQNGVVEFDNRS